MENSTGSATGLRTTAANGATTATATSPAPTTTPRNDDHYVPGSPIFRDDRKTPPITSAPPSTPKSRGKGGNVRNGGGIGTNGQHNAGNFPTMTVSLSHATQAAATIVTTTSSKLGSAPPTSFTTCYTTRSAAMMALALGQRTKSPAPSGAKNTSGGNCRHVTSSTTTTSTSSMAAATTSFVAAGVASSSPSRSPSPSPSPAPLALASGIQMNGNATAGTISGSSASSGSDNDGFNTSSSSSATALRRLYFKSGRKTKMTSSTATTSMTSIPMTAAATAYHTSMSGGLPAAVVAGTTNGVPKVVIMGSSTASATDANINTSTDSASTMITSVTHTDTSETCDSLDLGDNSGQSEPLFSSLEEPLLTAIQIDSEHDGTELELTSCSMYPRPDMNFQDSTESQESCLSILTGEPSSTTPLLSCNRRHNGANGVVSGKERLPNTAPPPTSSTKHFTFDPPKSPKSARITEKSLNQFSFKDQQHREQPNTPKQARRVFDFERSGGEQIVEWEERERTTNFIEERRRDHSPSKGKYRAYAAHRNSCYNHDGQEDDLGDNSRSKKSRARDSSSAAPSQARNRYSTGGAVVTSAIKTSPKRDVRRTSMSGKINSAPPTMKDINFFGSSKATKPQQLSPSAQHGANVAHQRKYSSSSSSGSSERDRERLKDATMFPFDREAIDYERIQRECFAVTENSSSATASSDSDEAEPCSVYERKLSTHHGSPKASDIFQQYSLLSQHEQQQQHQLGGAGGPPSRKNSKRIRPNSVIHSTIRENQQYVPQSDAFYPQQCKSSPSPGELPYTQQSPKSHAELNKFDEIASKFELIPPKHGSSANLQLLGNKASTRSPSGGSSPTGSLRGTTPPPLPDLRVDYFTESQMQARKKSFKCKANGPGGAAVNDGGSTSTVVTSSGATHDFLDDCQRGLGSGVGGVGGGSGCSAAGPINVTSNPMEAAVCTQPRATIVVQQPSLSLDNTVETLLIKNEGDFISVEQGKDSSNNGSTSNNNAGIGYGNSNANSNGNTNGNGHVNGSNGNATSSSHRNSNSNSNNTMSGALARKRNSQQLQPTHHHLGGTPGTLTAGGAGNSQQKRDENMRQLLDVTNTLTFEELRDFEMRYGSPHHSRSQSVKTPGSRASGRPNQLCLPQQRSRVASMPNTGVEEEYYRLRHFSITGKGVVNRGDSLKSRRSRSNNSVASSNSSTEHLTATQIPAPTSARTSATCSLASSRESSTSNPGNGPYRVLMLGGPAVGKSSLVSQFMTSEYLHAYDTSIGNCEIRIHIEKPADDDDSGEKAVSVLLSGEESELIFIDHPYTEMTPDDCLSGYDPHGYCVIYSAADRSSFTVAEHILQVLWTNQNIAQKAVILVANKADLARSRLVTSEEGKAMATAYDCKFIETSVGINHNVDELLVGLLSQIRLKLENPEKSRDLFRKRSIRKSKRRACSPLGGACLTGGTNPTTPMGGALNNVIADVNSPPGSAHSSPRKYRGSRTSTSLKVKGLLGRVWARDSKSKSCENLHVL